MTKLSPLHEVLFQNWTKAHGVDNHDDPENMFDHRELFQRTNGRVHPPGMVNDMAEAHNLMMQPQEQGTDPLMEMRKMQMEHDHKTSLERMKLEHKSKESKIDRQHKTHNLLLQEMLKRSAPQKPKTGQ